MIFFFLFSLENRLSYFMQMSICMKCQNRTSGKNRKNISKCRLLKILPLLDNLHDMSNPIFWENYKKKNINNLSSVDFAIHVAL